MLRIIRKKLKSDRGASSLISFMLIVPLFLGLVMTTVDMSFYFSNRAQVEAIARDAARTVGIYGGDGNATQATRIEKKYGTSRTTACSIARADIDKAPNKYIFANADKKNLSAVECNVLASLALNGGLVSVASDTPVIVDCGPEFTPEIGSRTYCTITYKYDGMPGAPLSFIQMRTDEGESTGLLSINKVTKSSESEVKYSKNDLVSRVG